MINEVALPETEQEKGEFAYLRFLVRNGPPDLISNVHASALALEFEGRMIPLILSDGNPADATVCSIQAHYVESPGSQLAQLDNQFYAAVARPFLGLLRCVIQSGGLGRVLYLNDWLMTTNPELRLNANQVKEIARFLTSKFPDRAIVIRSINKLTRAKLQRALQKNGFNMVRSRRIYIFDPSRSDFRRKQNLRRDIRLLGEWPGTIRKAPLDEHGIQRVAGLYRRLYLQKYSSGNPDLTTQFFRTVLNEGLFELRCLELDGEILAFTAWKTERESMLGTLVGYDLGRPQEMGLLRLAFALDFSESLDRKVPYHVSSGNGYFKRLRGAVSATEYDAVFSRHLSRKKRGFWKLFRVLMSLAEKSEGERIDFKRAPRPG